MNNLPIFIDIDGTLTNSSKRGGDPIDSRIQHVKTMISQGHDVVLWSATGTDYAKKFAKTHEIRAIACIGKPNICVDDCETIRKPGRINVIHPRDFFPE